MKPATATSAATRRHVYDIERSLLVISVSSRMTIFPSWKCKRYNRECEPQVLQSQLVACSSSKP